MITQKILEFNQSKGVDFYTILKDMYRDMPEDIQQICIFSDKDIEDTTDEDFDKLYNYVNNIYKVDKTKTSKDARLLHDIYINTLERCTGGGKKRVQGEGYFILSSFLDEDIIREVLCKSPNNCFNIFMMSNTWCPNKVPLIFKPSRRLLKYEFLEKELYPNSNTIKNIYADVEAIRNYPERIYIYPEDILELNIGMYHPYIWGCIQNERYNLLKCNI